MDNVDKKIISILQHTEKSFAPQVIGGKLETILTYGYEKCRECKERELCPN
jgi:hypothetical protein